MSQNQDLSQDFDKSNVVVIKNKFLAQIINNQVIIITKINSPDIIDLIPIQPGSKVQFRDLCYLDSINCLVL